MQTISTQVKYSTLIRWDITGIGYRLFSVAVLRHKKIHMIAATTSAGFAHILISIRPVRRG
jgi:hypothetical protein